MKRNEKELSARDCLERVSSQLTALHSTICTTMLGLQAEGIEEQSIHVLQCLESSVHDICNMISECIDIMDSTDSKPP